MKEIDKIKDRIIDVKEIKLAMQRRYDFVSQHDGEAYHPSQADLELWHKYDCYGAMEAWEKQGGGLTWKKDENGHYYFDEETARKEYQEFDEFCNQFVRQMTKADWLHFYTVLNNMYKHSLEDLYLQVEKLEHEGKKTNFKKSISEKAKHRDKIKKAVNDYYKTKYNGKGDCDTDMAREIIDALNSELGIKDFWKDPERSIKGIINDY